MKYALALVAVFVLIASPALAGDGNVSPSTLKTLGLGGMKVVSDTEGMKVRGMSSSAAAGGLSFAAAVAIDGVTFAVAANTQAGAGSATNAGLNALSTATSAQLAVATAIANLQVAVGTATGSSTATGQ